MMRKAKEICENVLDLYPPEFLYDENILHNLMTNREYMMAFILRMLWRHYQGLEPDDKEDLHRFASAFVEGSISGEEEGR